MANEQAPVEELKKASQIYKKGERRVMAEMDGSMVHVTQEVSGEVIGGVYLNEEELQRVVAFVEENRKRTAYLAKQKANQGRTKTEQEAFLLELSKCYLGEKDRLIKVGELLITEPLHGREEDGSFHYHYHAFIPERDKVIVLTFRIMGGDKYGNRIYTTRSYYAYGETMSYYHKTGGVKPGGKYGKAFRTVLELIKADKEPGFEPVKIV